MEHGWTPTVAMLADIFHALTGEPHPAAPKPQTGPKQDVSALAARLKEQRERIAAQRARATSDSSVSLPVEESHS